MRERIVEAEHTFEVLGGPDVDVYVAFEHSELPGYRTEGILYWQLRGTDLEQLVQSPLGPLSELVDGPLPPLREGSVPFGLIRGGRFYRLVVPLESGRWAMFIWSRGASGWRAESELWLCDPGGGDLAFFECDGGASTIPETLACLQVSLPQLDDHGLDFSMFVRRVLGSAFEQAAVDENAHVYFWQVDGGENLLCLVDASPRVLAAVQPGILIGFGGAGIVAEWVGCAPLPLQKRALPALFIERGRVFRCATDETAIDEEVEQLAVWNVVIADVRYSCGRPEFGWTIRGLTEWRDHDLHICRPTGRSSPCRHQAP